LIVANKAGSTLAYNYSLYLPQSSGEQVTQVTLSLLLAGWEKTRLPYLSFCSLSGCVCAGSCTWAGTEGRGRVRLSNVCIHLHFFRLGHPCSDPHRTLTHLLVMHRLMALGHFLLKGKEVRARSPPALLLAQQRIMVLTLLSLELPGLRVGGDSGLGPCSLLPVAHLKSGGSCSRSAAGVVQLTSSGVEHLLIRNGLNI